MNGPFHPGELRAQGLAGVTGAGGAIRPFMPDQHRTFFEQLPFVLLATTDADGSPRAAVLSGTAGFVSSPDPVTLRIALPLPGHTPVPAPNLSRTHAPTCAPADVPTLVPPDAALPAPGSPVGLLGIDLATRRRNRANGVVSSSANGALNIAVQESFGNCPQHIRRRLVRTAEAGAHPPSHFEGLDPRARDIVAHADTFFIATSGGPFGIDISHRGGPPGVAAIDGATLTVPDFGGNRYFNTLGNLLLDPRAALLFIDFDRGDVLELRGHVEILWDIKPGAVGQAEGRRWLFHVGAGTLAAGALPLRWDVLPD